MIEFVTFYADGGSKRALVEGDLDGPSQIDLFIKSARRIHPDAVFTVITDEITDLDLLPGDISVKRHKIDLNQIMLERTRLQAEHLNSTSFRCPVIFTDTDVLVCGKLSDLFDEDFDVGFTWRKSEEMPINGGVIYVNYHRPDMSRQIFNKLLETYQLKYANVAAWYGDQFAIMNLINLTFTEIYQSPTIDRGGAKVKLLPCDQYNFSPRENRPNLRSFNKNARIYHFKGMSRRLMKLFWDLHVDTQQSSAATRAFRLLYHDIRVRLQRRSYRSKLRRDIKRFNCGEQNAAAWVNRAEIAAQLVAKITAESDRPYSLADVGCGDLKLKSILANENVDVRYQGYDLVPQREEIEKFNIETESLPACDIAVALGVLEYSAEIAKPIRMLAGSATYLVVSHAVSDYRAMTPSSLKRLNWKTHLSMREFDKALNDNGFTVLENVITFNQKSVVWLCRKS